MDEPNIFRPGYGYAGSPGKAVWNLENTNLAKEYFWPVFKELGKKSIDGKPFYSISFIMGTPRWRDVGVGDFMLLKHSKIPNGYMIYKVRKAEAFRSSSEYGFDVSCEGNVCAIIFGEGFWETTYEEIENYWKSCGGE